jgi:DNA-binding transcriptional regulator YdaS (Cro superfamily)
MNLINIAINEAGSASKLAKELGVVPSAVGNWKARGIPRAWQITLEHKYKRAIRKAGSAPIQETVNV